MTLLVLCTLRAGPEGEALAGPLGISLVYWQLANLVGFLSLLFFFVVRPLTRVFRQRQLDVEERIREAQGRRAEAARLESEIHERMARLDQDLAEIRARGAAEGEAARAEFVSRAEREAESVRRGAEEEIGRRLSAAKEELARAAAHATASAAREVLGAQITSEDRQRLFSESVEGIGSLESHSQISRRS